MHEDLAARTASIRGGRGAGRRVRLAGRAGGGLDAGTAAGLRAGTNTGRRTDASRAAPDGSARREAGAEAAKGAVRASATRRRASVVLLALTAACGALAAGCAGSPPAAPAGEADRIPAPVLTPPPVPKPEPGEPVEVYSVSVEDVPAGELLFALARDAGLDIDVDPGIEGRITMNAVDEPLPDLLRRISRHAALRVEIEDGVLAARRDEPVLRAYPIDYVSVARDVETVNEVGTGLGGAIGSPAGGENGSSADVRGKAEHRFWDALVESVRAVLGESPDGASGGFAHRETSLIAVRASAARHREVAAFLDGVLASARRQVLIEAVIVEVGLDDRFRSGVNFSRLFGGDLRAQTGLPGGNFGDSAPFALLSSADLGLTVRLLREFGEVQVLSTPIVMALNNQTAIVKIAENRAFFTSEVRTTSNDTTIERNVQTKLHTVPVGLILLVTPSVAADGEIVLKVRPTVTRQTGFVIDPNPTLAAAEVVSRIPEIAVREIESVLRLRSGEVAVLGGLMQEESREDTAGVPLLSRLPGIGAAFRYRDRRTEKTELIVFLRPTVVRDPSLDADLGRFHRWWRRTGEPAGREAVRGPGPDPDSRPDRRTVPAAGAAGAAAPATGTGKQEGIRIEQAWGGNPADGMLGRAWTALQRGALRGARASYLEALDARPAAALAGLGALAVREGRIAEARAWYRRLLALEPAHEIGRAMAAVLDAGGSPEAHEREIRDRLSDLPEAAWLHAALGHSFAGRGRWEAAADAYRTALRLAPSNPDPAYNLAVSADRLDRRAAALVRYREALELAALSPPAFDVRAVRERIAALEGRVETRP